MSVAMVWRTCAGRSGHLLSPVSPLFRLPEKNEQMPLFLTPLFPLCSANEAASASDTGMWKTKKSSAGLSQKKEVSE
jgi:hypothetical protein